LQERAHADGVVGDRQAAGDIIVLRAEVFALGEGDEFFDFVEVGEGFEHGGLCGEIARFYCR